MSQSATQVAFTDCSSLMSVALPDSVANIGERAFEGCGGLTNMALGNGVTNIAWKAFCECGGLESLTIPGSVAGIGNNAFYGCTNLASVAILGNVTNNWVPNGLAEEYSNVPFFGCGKLSSVVFGERVAKIGACMFYGCSGLESVTIPPGVKSVGDDAFYGCTNLTAVHIRDLAAWCGIEFDGWGSNPLRYAGHLYLDGREVAGDLAIPAGVTGIGGAFVNCKALTSVTIPAGVACIGDSAFCWCNGLTNIAIPGSVTNIGPSAFAECRGLTNVIVPDSVENIGDSAFVNCYALADVAIGNGVTNIGPSAFGGCIGLTNAIVPDSVENIGARAFANCGILAGVAIGNGVTNIGDSAFADCPALERMDVPDRVETIGSCAFQDCSALQSVTIGNGVKRIGAHAFDGCPDAIFDRDGMPGLFLLDGWVVKADDSIAGALDLRGLRGIAGHAFFRCSGLTSVALPDGLACIEEGAFYGCTSLASVTIPDSVAEIGSSAFRGCSALRGVAIPESVAAIGYGAFYECGGLERLTIPESVTSIGRNAFYCCTNLASVSILGNVTNDWVRNWLQGYPDVPFFGCRKLANVVLGERMEKIGAGMFYGCSGLASVTIPPGVKSIGYDAFCDCDGLATVNVRDLAAWCGIEFGAGNFSNPLACAHHLRVNGSEVRELAIPEGVEEIGSGAFRGGSDFTGLAIPDSVKSIGLDAFAGCTGVGAIATGNGVASLTNLPLYRGLTNIAIGSGVREIHAHAFTNCSALASVEIPDTVANIGEGAFYGCNSLETAAIGNGVTNIGNEAFRSCGNLAALEIGDGVESIGYQAFRDCRNLSRVTVGTGVTAIGSGAFNGCGNLKEVRIRDLAAWCGLEFNGWEANPLSGSPRLYLDGVEVTGDVAVPEGTAKIGKYAFYGWNRMTGVSIPDSVTNIGYCAFCNCQSLTNAAVGNGVKSVAERAFAYCENLEAVCIRDLAAWCGIAFEGWAANPLLYARHLWLDGEDLAQTAALAIPDGVTDIGSGALSGCTNLASLSIPGSVTNIGANAFSACGGLATLHVPAEWEGTDMLSGAGVAADCTVVYGAPESETVDGVAWNYTVQNGSAIVLPGDYAGDLAVPAALGGAPVARIASGAFAGCGGLAGLAVPDGVTCIGALAFRGCGALSRVEISGNVTNDWTHAKRPFSGCTNLETVVLGGNTAKIGANMFAGCTGLAGVTVPGSVTCIGTDAFYGCDRLTAVHIHDLAAWCGIKFEGWAANPLRYAGHLCLDGEEVTDLAIPGSVTGIGNYAFCYCSGLTNAMIGNGVTNIGEYAFYGCSGLANVTIGNGVTCIGESAFWGCTRLAGLTIPDSVVHIGSWVFSGCWGLAALEVPTAWYGTAMLAGTGVPEGCTVTYRGIEPLAVETETLAWGTTGIGYEAALAATGGIGSYTWTTGVATNYEERTAANTFAATGTAKGWRGDDSCWDLALPFEFPYFGQTYTRAKVNSNGALSFGDADFTEYSYSSDTFSRSPIVAVLWKDLDTRYGDICVESGADAVTVRWQGTDYSGGGEVNFSATLRKDGRIVLSYGAGNGSGGAIGISAGDGTTSLLSARSNSGSMANADDIVFAPPAGLPEGLALSAEGMIAGTPAAAGEYEFTVTVTDAAGVGASRKLALAVADGTEVLDGVTWRYGLVGGTATVLAGPTDGAVAIPASLGGYPVTAIGGNAFAGCGSLTELTIPDSVAEIAEDTFAGCSGLARVEVPGAWYGTDKPAHAGLHGTCEITYRGVGRLEVATASLPTGAVGEAYTATLEATGGLAPYAWSVAEGGADYEETSAASTYAATGTAQGWQADDSCWNLALPFAFPFFGNTYTNAKINSNGTISFGNDSFAAYSYSASTFKASPIIAVLWTDLTTASGNIYVESGVDAVTVRWQGAYYSGGAVNFSATLCKDGRIVLSYGAGNASGGAIGISAGDGTTARLSAKHQSGSMANAEDIVFAPPVNLPEGLALSAEGVIAGTPVAAGTNTFTVVVTDAAGVTATKELTLAIADGGAEEGTTASGVPHEWLDHYGLGDGTEAGYEAAADAKAVNGMAVWECYVAGLSPTEEKAFTVTLSFDEDGTPVVSSDPAGIADRTYTVEGVENMGDAWGPTNAATRFFRVKVAMPE